MHKMNKLQRNDHAHHETKVSWDADGMHLEAPTVKGKPRCYFYKSKNAYYVFWTEDDGTHMVSAGTKDPFEAKDFWDDWLEQQIAGTRAQRDWLVLELARKFLDF